MSLIAPAETTVRGRLGTADEIAACLEAIRVRHRELVGREASVRYYEDSRAGNWAHASAALALDRYLASPLEHELDRASRDAALSPRS